MVNFTCPDSFERNGCKEPNLRISISLVDLVAISLISGRKVRELFDSPFVVDLKSVAGNGLEGVPISESGRAHLPHHRVEKLISQRLREGGYLDDWKAKIEKLDRADGLEDSVRMKRWTDQMAMVSDGFSSGIVYQFDGNRLLPVHLCK